MKKILKIGGIILVVILIAITAILVDTHYKIKRGDLVKWDGQWYTKEELKAKYPPQYIEVPAKNTPEDVYAKFREALLKNDTETALGLMSNYRKNEYIEAFKDKEKTNDWVKRLPEIIIKENILGNFASYYYLNAINKNDKIAHPINFSKNNEGYWKIDSI